MDSSRPPTKPVKRRFTPKPRPPKKEEDVTPKIDKDDKSDTKPQESPVGRSSNVGPGLDCSSVQTVMAINTEKKHCCELGTVEKKAVVTPDVDSLLANESD